MSTAAAPTPASAPAARVVEAQAVLRDSEVLVTAEAVAAACDRLAARIDADYAGKLPLVLCVMNGGLYATAEITRRLSQPIELDYLHATRYRGDTQGGGLTWKREPDPAAIAGRHVLVIDDILDEGPTLAAIRSALLALAPASLAVAVLADKLHDRRAVGAKAEYVGFTVPDRYVFGCGMDVRELWRQLPAVHAVGAANGEATDAAAAGEGAAAGPDAKMSSTDAAPTAGAAPGSEAPPATDFALEKV